MRVTFLHIYCTREGQLVFHENRFKILSIFLVSSANNLSLSLLCDSRTVQNIFKENICRFLRNSIVNTYFIQFGNKFVQFIIVIVIDI